MTMAQAFDEWMRLYIKDPCAFEAQFQTVAAFQRGRKIKGEPAYGQEMAAYLRQLMRKPTVRAAQVARARRPRR